MRKKCAEDEEDGRHLVARNVRCHDGLGESEVDGQDKAITLLARLRDALELQDFVSQLLLLCLQLLDLCCHWLHVKEQAVGAHLVVRILCLELLGNLLAAGLELPGLFIDLLLQDMLRLLSLRPLRLLLSDAGPDASLVQALHLRLELRDCRGVLLVSSRGIRQH
eukprot:484690-Pleurochrysis_carterae.AAC.3